MTWSSTAWCGSYLTRAAVLLRSADIEAKAVSRRFSDKELARLAHKVALARVEASQNMQVPPEVKRSHPHLLLALESYERACHAAVQARHTDFLVALSKAREESMVFSSLLKQDGWSLPKLAQVDSMRAARG